MKYLLIIAVIFIVIRFFRVGILSYNSDAAQRELDRMGKNRPVQDAHSDEYISYEEIE